MILSRFRAVNTAPDSENQIHRDDIARRYGFRGGLVPGVAVYGSMTAPILDAWGRGWFGHGAASLRLQAPVYDGEEILLRTHPDGDAITVTAEREGGEVCATVLALRGEFASEFEIPPAGPLPRERPDASEETLLPGTPLGSFCETAGDGLLELANQLLLRNFRMAPWLHAGSGIRHHAAVDAGQSVEVRGRITAEYERKGHRFVALDIAILSDSALVQTIRHTAIWKIRANP